MLTFSDLRLRFGGVTALDDVSFTVPQRSICGVIGPNGAGKTSLFNCVSRLYRPTAGSIRLGDVDVLGVAAHDIREIGISRTFQHVGAFPSLTVRENVALGSRRHPGRRFWPSLAGTRALAHDAGVEEAIERLGLAEIAEEEASELSYGTLKRVEIARTLASRPKVLLLDEPAAGLVQSEVDELGELLTELRAERDLTIVLIEHHMRLVMGVCDTVAVLDFGRFVMQGPPAEVRDDPRVVQAYLGAAA